MTEFENEILIKLLKMKADELKNCIIDKDISSDCLKLMQVLITLESIK